MFIVGLLFITKVTSYRVRGCCNKPSYHLVVSPAKQFFCLLQLFVYSSSILARNFQWFLEALHYLPAHPKPFALKK